ncbi:MAG: SurA N-terminal domain-containing protein [Burkholderiales bacterium]
MLEAIRRVTKGWLAKLILALITIPFALWGVESYVSNTDSAALVARIGDQRITQQEFLDALKSRRVQLQQSLGANFDPAMLEQNEFREALIEQLIDQRVLAEAARKSGYTVSDQELATTIAAYADFQEDGRFSQTRFERILRNQGITPLQFDAMMRADAVVNQYSTAVAGSVSIPRSVLLRVLTANEQQREVSRIALEARHFVNDIVVDIGEAKRYYETHANEFMLPRRVRIEYVVLSPEVLGARIQVSEQEIQDYYREHAAQFVEVPERRRASHILLKTTAGGDAAAQQKVRDQAANIAREARADPGGFAALAKRYSIDSGSAAGGGDLGYFTRGAMAKPFEDAVFALRPGAISEPVESPFGYHVIMLTGIKAGRAMPLEKARQGIRDALALQNAGREFTDVAENFSNRVYEESDRLAPTAKTLGLNLQTSDWITESGADVTPLNSAKFLQAVFGDDAIAERRNTEAVEIAPNTLVAARVIDYKPAAVKPFDQASEEITRRLRMEKAARIATERGRALLASLDDGKPVDMAWPAALTVTREQSNGLSEAEIHAVFKTLTSKLPAFIGLENADGYALFKISKVSTAEVIDEERRQAYADGVRTALAQAHFKALLGALREEHGVTLFRENLQTNR